jgi:hypothetical protein
MGKLMSFEFLVEDQSSKRALEILLPKIIGGSEKLRIHSYKGLGHIPKGMHSKSDPNKRILLDQLPRLLQGYGNTPYEYFVVVICDLDDKDRQQFLSELNGVLENCNPKPEACFCLAIEEFEAWYLGDPNAVRTVYPKADDSVLSGYKNDSICGTWELLADAVLKGGHKGLSEKGWQAVGEQKSIWAREISRHMNVDENISPSFVDMRTTLRSIVANWKDGRGEVAQRGSDG